MGRKEEILLVVKEQTVETECDAAAVLIFFRMTHISDTIILWREHMLTSKSDKIFPDFNITRN